MDVAGSDPITLGAVVMAAITLAGGLLKLVDKLVDRFIPKKDPYSGHVEEGQRVEKKVDLLLEWHNAKDVNGLPLGYFPRSMVEDQKRIAEILQEVSEQMERVADKLDHHDERTERGFTEVRRDVGRLGK